MPFFVALANTNTGAPMVAGTERQLIPAPKTVIYPEERFGEERTTADGQVIVQQQSSDARSRSWIWENYEPRVGAYERQWAFLRSLRSRTRFETGASPYIYVCETETNLLSRRVSTVLTLAGAGSTLSALVCTSGATAAMAGAEIEILSTAAGSTGTGAYQRASVLSVAGQTLTLRSPLTTIPHGARIAVIYWTSPYFRARVLEVERVQSRDTTRVRYATSTFRFVIDDPTFSLS